MKFAANDDSLETTSDSADLRGRALHAAIYCRYARLDRRLIVFAMVLVGLVNFGFCVEEYDLPTGSVDCGRIAQMRALIMAFSIAVACWTPFIRSTRALQLVILGWQIICSTLFVWTDHLLPAAAYQNSLADLAYLIAIFVFMPNRLSYQYISGTYFTAIHLWMLFSHSGFSHLWWEAALIFPISAICGAYISWRMHKTRIAEFGQWRSEHMARIKLEGALDKIKKLSGLLPICSYCKKVRDDHGYWHEVETFIRNHSSADFSHSLCPDCGQEHYPGLLTAEDFEEDSSN